MLQDVQKEYLLSFFETEFLVKGGEVSWLTGGLNAIPVKLQKIEVLNVKEIEFSEILSFL